MLSTPAFALLRRALPEARVHVAMEDRFADVLAGQPDIDGVLKLPWGGGLGAKSRLLRKIRALRPSLCIDMHGGSTAAWLTALSGARWRAGFRHFRQGWAYNVRVPRAQQVLGRAPDAPVHTAEHHAAAIVHLGGAIREIPPARLRRAPSRHVPPYAVIHAGAAFHTKAWPVERFRALAAELLDRHGLKPVFVAGPGDEAVAEELADLDVRKGLPLESLLSLLSGARLFVGNDSGPAHVAAAYSVPCAVIFGSSDSGAWHPWRTPHRIIETDWECKPCPGDRCYEFDEPLCILTVGLPDVSRAVGELLSAAGSPS